MLNNFFNKLFHIVLQIALRAVDESVSGQVSSSRQEMLISQVLSPSYSTCEHGLAKHFDFVFCANVYLTKVIFLRPNDILMIGDLSCFAQLINIEGNFVPYLYPAHYIMIS